MYPTGLSMSRVYTRNEKRKHIYIECRVGAVDGLRNTSAGVDSHSSGQPGNILRIGTGINGKLWEICPNRDGNSLTTGGAQRAALGIFLRVRDCGWLMIHVNQNNKFGDFAGTSGL
jgi:hypothetical protein